MDNIIRLLSAGAVQLVQPQLVKQAVDSIVSSSPKHCQDLDLYLASESPELIHPNHEKNNSNHKDPQDCPFQMSLNSAQHISQNPSFVNNDSNNSSSHFTNPSLFISNNTAGSDADADIFDSVCVACDAVLIASKKSQFCEFDDDLDLWLFLLSEFRQKHQRSTNIVERMTAARNNLNSITRVSFYVCRNCSSALRRFYMSNVGESLRAIWSEQQSNSASTIPHFEFTPQHTPKDHTNNNKTSSSYPPSSFSAANEMQNHNHLKRPFIGDQGDKAQEHDDDHEACVNASFTPMTKTRSALINPQQELKHPKPNPKPKSRVDFLDMPVTTHNVRTNEALLKYFQHYESVRKYLDFSTDYFFCRACSYFGESVGSIAKSTLSSTKPKSWSCTNSFRTTKLSTFRYHLKKAKHKALATCYDLAISAPLNQNGATKTKKSSKKLSSSASSSKIVFKNMSTESSSTEVCHWCRLDTLQAIIRGLLNSSSGTNNDEQQMMIDESLSFGVPSKVFCYENLQQFFNAFRTVFPHSQKEMLLKAENMRFNQHQDSVNWQHAQICVCGSSSLSFFFRQLHVSKIFNGPIQLMQIELRRKTYNDDSVTDFHFL